MHQVELQDQEIDNREGHVQEAHQVLSEEDNDDEYEEDFRDDIDEQPTNSQPISKVEVKTRFSLSRNLFNYGKRRPNVKFDFEHNLEQGSL